MLVQGESDYRYAAKDIKEGLQHMMPAARTRANAVYYGFIVLSLGLIVTVSPRGFANIGITLSSGTLDLVTQDREPCSSGALAYTHILSVCPSGYIWIGHRKIFAIQSWGEVCCH